VFFLVGALAIAALPPLNGFVSEWLLFQAVIAAPQLPQPALHFASPAIGAMLALAAALAAACFVRVYGIAFLGRPRSNAARDAHESERVSVVAMGLLAAACLVLGILPGFAIDALAPVTYLVAGGRMPVQTAVEWLSTVPIAESRSSYNGMLVFVFIAASGMIAAFVIHRLASDKIRRGAIWDCGFPDASTVTQYSDDSFAQPIRRIFGTVVFRAREIGEMPTPSSTAPARFTAIVRDPIWDTLYAPLTEFVAFTAEKLNVLQFLTIRRYLSLVFAALVLLLLVLASWP
jgi:NADH:ubiquinone oxidoreductase subunit 5 (subunit L)/multisubunit Na+/H+ antiporter MnhA subunit